jgi:hypothetical protein
MINTIIDPMLVFMSVVLLLACVVIILLGRLWAPRAVINTARLCYNILKLNV